MSWVLDLVDAMKNTMMNADVMTIVMIAIEEEAAKDANSIETVTHMSSAELSTGLYYCCIGA
ncbi:MAG: hypothetical protein WBJ13_14615 [Sedimentibacter sp.]